MATRGDAHIRLCGCLQAVVGGREVEPPGHQGRVLLAFLVLNRGRDVGRGELLEVLWPERAPADPGEALSAVLSRLRRALGPGVLEGRRGLRLELPEDVYVDVEAAQEMVQAAEAALRHGNARAALAAGRETVDTVADTFLPGADLPWVDERRRDLEELRFRALEAVAGAGIALGGAELAAAERAARVLVEVSPFRESGHRLLMEALAARGELAEALRAYETLRVTLRDELGASPGPAAQELHGRLLRGEAPGPALNNVREPVEPAPREERKLVTVLCAEPAAAGDAADPEDLRAALAAAGERLRTTVERLGGAVQDAGVGPALAVFGAAAAHENDAESGVRAALELCETGAAARAAVASGEALVSGPQRVATGEVVGGAIRLLTAAPGGRVAVDQATRAATRRVVDCVQEAGTWIVRELRARARPATTSVPLIGRLRELTALEQLYGTVVDQGSPRLVMLAGAPGIGKSRLAEEFALRAARRGASVHRGRCLSYGAGVSCWAMHEVLWDAASIALDDDAPAATRKLRDLAERLDLDSPTLEALATGTGIAMPGGQLEEAPAETVAEEISLAWPGLLTALASRGPVVLLIEDLHWADEELLGMLERLATRAQGPLMVLVTARREFAVANPAWGSQTGVSQIALEPLAEAHARELVDELLPDAPADLRGRVGRLAEGNPFFAEEIARHVAAGGDSTAMPHNVRALLTARIDALPAGEKSVLQHAAVVGRRFWTSALEPNQTGLPLPPLLRSLEERGFVVTRPVSSLPGERELWFVHGLTREVAYRSIPRGARARVHAAVGAWLERLSGDRREEFIGLIAHHHEAAAGPREAALAWPDDPRRREKVRAAAVAALLEAGGAARRGVMPGDALRFADRALALAADDRERLAGLDLRARAFHTALRSDDALTAYRDALVLAEELGEHAETARLRAHAVLLCACYSGGFADESWIPIARELVAQGLRETGEHSESFETGALLIGRSWARARWPGVTERDVAGARRDIERAVEVAESIGSRYLLSHALQGLTWAIFADGFSDAEAMGERLLRTAGPMSNRIEAHESVGLAAICFARAGRFDRAREEAAKTTRMVARLSPHRALHAAAAEAIALIPAGGFFELLEATGAVLEFAEEEDNRICATGLVAVAGRALALFEAGSDAEVERAIGLLRRLTPTPGSVRTYGYPTAEILRPVLGVDATRSWIESAQPVQDAAGRVHRLRAWLPVVALDGDEEALRPALADARALAGPAGAPALRSIADLAEAILWARRGRASEALVPAERAAATLDRRGEHYTAARLLAELLHELGYAAESSEPAVRTAARLTGMGAHASARLLLGRVPRPWQTSATR